MSLPESTTYQDQEFKKGLGLSAIVHISLLIFFLLKVTFFQDQVIDLSQSIRVDMVGLPDKITNNTMSPQVEKILNDKDKLPPKKETHVETQKPEPKPAQILPTTKTKPSAKADHESINLNKTKSKQKAALEKLKKLSAVEKIRQEVRSEAEIKALQAFTQALPKGPIKGRIISAGSALTGLDRLDANNYLQNLDQQIKQHWTLPQWLINKPLKAQVLVKIDSNGRLISKSIVASSRNTTYDNYCLQAVEEAAPFPNVPEKFSEKFSIEGIIIGFPE